jgi:alkaline phosphatase D
MMPRRDLEGTRMALDRREVIRLLAAMGLAPWVLSACDDGDGGGGKPGDAGTDGPLPDGEVADLGLPDDGFPRYTWEGEPGPETLFEHGVASGDPLPEAVVLWTRVSVDSGSDPVEVFYEIATLPDFRQRTAVGTLSAEAVRDFTVKHDATGLTPGTTYYYRFSAQGRTSRTGRTRTAPVGAVDHLRFAVASCASLAHGYFHAYRQIAERADLDAVIHLGDYIYEYASGSYGDVRPYEPVHEIVSLADYRLRFSQYHRDPDLQAVHQQHPIIPIWDDHETANNSWRDGAENHNADEGDWQARKAAAIQAWYEWLPVRDTEDHHIYRRLRYGELVDLIMLDTRLWGRDEPVGGNTAQVDRFSEELTLLGQDQEMWLREQLAGSTAQWKVVGQQVMMGQLLAAGAPISEGGGTALNFDQWDGYVASRNRFFQILADNSLDDVVVLTGDIHTSWAIDLSPDPNDPALYDRETGEGAVAVEFVTPGITSPGLAALSPALLNLIYQQNGHIKWADLAQKGYLVLDVTPERVQADWYLLTAIKELEYTAPVFARGYASFTGENHLVAAEAPAPEKDDAPALAPEG